MLKRVLLTLVLAAAFGGMCKPAHAVADARTDGRQPGHRPDAAGARHAAPARHPVLAVVVRFGGGALLQAVKGDFPCSNESFSP